jgi:Fe2+ transport system protein FeoA
MGIIPKVKIELVRKAPFGGAYILKINEQHYLAIRESEAAIVEIDIL